MFVSPGITSWIKAYKKAAFLAVFITNLFTGAFVFAFNYWLGKTVLGWSPDFIFPDKIGIDFIYVVYASGKNVLISLLQENVSQTYYLHG